jgi:Family of unknown function (DUF6518)
MSDLRHAAPVARWLSVVALGALLGTLTARADVLAGGLGEDGLWRAASMVLNAGCVWAGLAVLSGWIVGRPMVGALAGAIALLAAVGGYYAFGVAFGDRTQVGFGGLTGAVRMWGTLAIVVGPVLGVVGALIHRPPPLGLLAALVVPAGVIVEMVGLRRLGSESFAVDPALAWAQAAMVVLAIGGAATAVIAYLGTPLRSPKGVADREQVGGNGWPT